jgi:hypothetical protein
VAVLSQRDGRGQTADATANDQYLKRLHAASQGPLLHALINRSNS